MAMPVPIIDAAAMGAEEEDVDVEDGTLWACQMVKSKRQSSFSKR
jgi:hypothetical protein